MFSYGSMPPDAITDTEGRRLLARVVASSSQAEVARQVGTEASSVSFWVDGKSRPLPHYREVLELLFGIPRESWMLPDERAKVDQARVQAKQRSR